MSKNDGGHTVRSAAPEGAITQYTDALPYADPGARVYWMPLVDLVCVKDRLLIPSTQRWRGRWNWRCSLSSSLVSEASDFRLRETGTVCPPWYPATGGHATSQAPPGQHFWLIDRLILANRGSVAVNVGLVPGRRVGMHDEQVKTGPTSAQETTSPDFPKVFSPVTSTPKNLPGQAHLLIHEEPPTPKFSAH